MPQVLELQKEYRPWLYDSDTGESLVAEKVVDITDSIPDGERTLLLFTRAKRGRIAQIWHPYAGEVYMGVHVHYFIDELAADRRSPESGFGHTAKRMGLRSAELHKIIRENAPE